MAKKCATESTLLLQFSAPALVTIPICRSVNNICKNCATVLYRRRKSNAIYKESRASHDGRLKE